MKFPQFSPLSWVVVAFALAWPGTHALQAREPFLGPIPVQFVPPGKELVLDMHRFYDAGDKPSSLQVRVDSSDEHPACEARFDEDKCELHVRLTRPEAGMSNVMLSTSAHGKGMESVLTVIARPADADARHAPTLYYDHLHPATATSFALEMTEIAVRIVRGDAPVGKFSVVFEDSHGAECLESSLVNGDVLMIPGFTKDVAGFLRIVAVDDQGNASNVLRFPVGDPKAFHWQDAVLYYALTDRFANGDKSNDRPDPDPNVTWPANYHGGDLAGIRQKIEEGYFERLGVNTLWLAPLNRNPDRAYREYPEPHRWYTGYHGYWPVSPTEIDPRFGTANDLHALVRAAHARGIKVLADLVLHHVHEEHPWWKEHPDWFGSLMLPDGRQNLRLWDEQQFTTWFEPFMPSFDFSKDAPTQALIDNSVWWLETYDLDGFRLDAVKHISPQFWWKFRAALRERVEARRGRPLFLVGETFKDRDGIAGFVGPNMLDGQFDFPLYEQIKETFALGKDDMLKLERAQAESARVYGAEALMSPLLDNHDKPRFLAYADKVVKTDMDSSQENAVGWTHAPKDVSPMARAELELSQAYLMTLVGVPMLYYGDEIGLTGAGDPDNRRDMKFGGDVDAAGRAVESNFDRLGAFRRAHPAVRYGSRRTALAERDVLAVVRASLDDRVLMVFNRGAAEAKISLPVAPELTDGEYTDALGSGTFAVKDGRLAGTFPARKALLLTKVQK